MDSRVVGENKGTSKVVLQFADAISSMASFINRLPLTFSFRLRAK